MYIEKIAMIRPFSNPKSQNLNLDIDWSLEYSDIDQNQKRYNCILKSFDLDLNFKIEGILKLELSEKFNQEICSKLIFNKACELLMSTFSLTRESTYCLADNKSYDYFDSEDIHGTLFN